jgi:L-2-hydroxyglutarate oxidase LhgO
VESHPADRRSLVSTLTALAVVALVLRPQIIAIGPLQPAIQADLDISHSLAGRSPFGRHIYPMPDGAWLGLHVTVDIGGRCKFGPDIEWIPEIDYAFKPEKLEKFLGFIRTYYPGLDPERLHADYTGIRPKLYREGEPVPDFFLHGPEAHGLDRLMLLYGIESPGLTASMALAEMVADRI